MLWKHNSDNMKLVKSVHKIWKHTKITVSCYWLHAQCTPVKYVRMMTMICSNVVILELP